jgi:hypothetical protein
MVLMSAVFTQSSNWGAMRQCKLDLVGLLPVLMGHS